MKLQMCDAAQVREVQLNLAFCCIYSASSFTPAAPADTRHDNTSTALASGVCSSTVMRRIGCGASPAGTL